MLSLLFFSSFLFFGVFISSSWLFLYLYLPVMVFLWTTHFYSPFNSFYLINWFSHLDSLSCGLCLLTTWITIMIVLCRYGVEFNNIKDSLFLLVITFLFFVLLICFITTNYLIFYIFFEISLIPTLILILGWGYQPERLQAALYLIIYTMCGSLPLLIIIVIFYNCGGSLYMGFVIKLFYVNYKFSSFIWLIFIMAFIIKIPIYLTHLWLPKAHVEAPVAGSIILAGILLKLGGYGLLRVRCLFPLGNTLISPLFSSVSIWGAFITSLICIRQTDLKSLIAYSSVGHIALLISGLLGGQSIGYAGSFLIILAHGLVSSGIFCLANILYESTSTRRIFMIKGFINILPHISLFCFILLAINIGAPPSINLLGEILLLTSILNLSISFTVLVGISSFMAGAYSLYLYTSTQHGFISSYLNRVNILNSRIITSLFLHIFPCVGLILSLELVTFWF